VPFVIKTSVTDELKPDEEQRKSSLTNVSNTVFPRLLIFSKWQICKVSAIYELSWGNYKPYQSINLLSYSGRTDKLAS